jgi:hypothetical protein
MEDKWERIAKPDASVSDCSRLKVPGGWLVALSSGNGHAITFFADPQHQWVGPHK